MRPRRPLILLLILGHLLAGFAPVDELLRCRVTGEQGAICCCTGLDVAQWQAAAEPCGCCEHVLDERADERQPALIARGEPTVVADAASVVAIVPPSLRLPTAARERAPPVLAQAPDPPPGRPLYIRYAALLI